MITPLEIRPAHILSSLLHTMYNQKTSVTGEISLFVVSSASPRNLGETQVWSYLRERLPARIDTALRWWCCTFTVQLFELACNQIEPLCCMDADMQRL